MAMTSFKYYSAALLLVSSLAHANHTAFNWQGPYLGGYIGGAWGKANIDTDVGSVTNSSYFNSSKNINAVNKSGSHSPHSSTLMGGVQLGDNFVINNVLFGLVLDYGSFTLSPEAKGRNVYPDNSGNYSVDTSVSSDWLYTMRGRIGYIPMHANPFLVYVTGGLALTNPSVSNDFSDGSSLSGIGGGSDDSVQAGWTVGLGLDFPIYQHLTINAEYLFVQFNSVDVDSMISNTAGGFGIPPNSLYSPFVTSADLSANLLKVGVNYKF